MSIDILKISKYLGVLLSAAGSILTAFNLDLQVLGYGLFVVGNVFFLYYFYKTKDWSLWLLQLLWLGIDLIGIFRWS